MLATLRMGTIRRYRYELGLLLMLIVAAGFRFYKLDAPSLWYDELYTVNQSNPDISWKQLFHYIKTDQHPPLYFILQRWTFTLLSYTEWAARSLSALCGVLCVWGMYLLGKELKDKRLGLIAAALLIANQYSIRYSHDARPYTMVWLLVIFSYLYLIRTIKSLRNTDAILYCLFTTALIYTNYFAILAVVSQGLIVLRTGMKEKKDRRRFFSVLCISAAIIAVAYIPWYKYLFLQVGLKPFWLTPEPAGFLFTYYYAYFGGERFLMPFLLLAPVSYAYYLYRVKVFKEPIRVNNDRMGLLFITYSVAIPFIVLTAYSILRTPILQMRYALVVLPGLFLMVAYGINAIKKDIIVIACTVLFVGLATYNVLYRHHFFSFPTEMQYRQATRYMVQEGRTYPMVNRANGWQMQYYTYKYGQTGKLITANKNKAIDPILMRSPGYDIDTFWVVTGFVDAPLGSQARQKLERSFVKVKERQFKSVTVELYGRKR